MNLASSLNEMDQTKAEHGLAGLNQPLATDGPLPSMHNQVKGYRGEEDPASSNCCYIADA